MQARYVTPSIVAVTLGEGEALFGVTGPAEVSRVADDALLDALGEAGIDVEPYTPPPPPDPTAPFGAAIQAHLDATARARGYDGALSITTYIGSSIPQWAAEAAAFFAWRDQVWAYAYTELAKVKARQRGAPTPAELVEELPAISWPT